MAPKLPDPGTNTEGMLQALCEFLPAGSPSQQRCSQVPLGLKDAEEVGGNQWQQLAPQKNKYHQDKCNFPLHLTYASIK
jgi:hypothetical protein